MAKNGHKDLFVKTPLIESLELKPFGGSRKVYLKLESAQPAASFKMRGISRVCQKAARDGYKEIVCASGGNAGLAAACAARQLGLKCRIVVPNRTSDMMKDKIAREGADIETVGDVWDDANDRALQVIRECKQALYIHPFDDPIVWTGHSTMIDEIAADLNATPSMIITCCGGGGLLCGIIEGMRRHGWTSVPVLAMETTGANSLNAAVTAAVDGVVRPVILPAITSIATTLGTYSICDQLAKEYNASAPPVLSHMVEDRDAVDACLKFADHHRILVEPACGATLAALYTGLVERLLADNEYGSGPVVVIVCGGAAVNIDIFAELKSRFNL
ncbi:unnamed protein product [Medioppia subpectinata]|uniref:L-serine ammonia-lyase n=1 Tax=Medioppia subpectinata TaxID=1979941 RepID=A0A7R9PWA4_9ACAR|nr:unnamed protein product [Medioppia subpectinata]CAG2103562.1 unnamed protein product [Medioppia subpectinata]